MFRPRILARALLVAGLACASLASAGTVTIYRDTFGVPYIYGDTDAGAAFGLGYAQAEDRLDDLYINIRQAVGRMAEVLGKDHLQSDYMMRLARNAERCAEYWPTAPAPLRAIGEGFVAGVNAWLADNPGKDSPYALDLEPWHGLAVMRAMILNWPLGDIRDELRQESNTLGWGSNEWAVAPERSADGSAILLADPHLTWQGMSVFYEAHVYGDALAEQHGFFLVGVYLLAYGHNQHVGWAPTTGGPDTGDVYAMKINPDNPTQYEYDGEWRDAQVGMISISVKDGDPVQMPTYTTHLGPAFAEPDIEKQTILVGATPYFDQMQLLEQAYKTLQARNVDEFTEAISMNQFMQQNLMSADRDGNIAYARVGMTPIRPEGYDWGAPVPGNTSKTAWLGIHPLSDHVQIKNPPHGYMQNCNISPEFMMVDSPLTPDKYIDYLYNVSWDTRNSRGDRALQVLDADGSLTREEAIDLAFDITDPYWAGWKSALEKVAIGPAKVALEDPGYKADFDRLLNWDARYHRDSTAAPLVRYFRLAAFEKVDPGKVNAGRHLNMDELFALKDALDEARDQMTALYGRTDIAWGDMITVGRGGKFFPASGGDYGGGENDKRVRSLLSLGVRETEQGSGKYLANKGSMAMILMFMHEDGVESYTCVPWGQSADPDSPHYMDQGEKLFTQRKFKPVYRTKEALLENTTSQKALTYDPS